MIPDGGLFKRGTPNHDNLSQLAWDYMAGDHLCIGRTLGGDHITLDHNHGGVITNLHYHRK